MVIAPIICKICEKMVPCINKDGTVVPWQLFYFAKDKEFNICDKCISEIMNQYDDHIEMNHIKKCETCQDTNNVNDDPYSDDYNNFRR